MPVKHTPAPWVHKSFSNCDAVVANGVVVATVGITANDEIPDDFDMTKQQADAKLIAAAPDLYDALQLIVDNKTLPPELLIPARAALDKATATA